MKKSKILLLSILVFLVVILAAARLPIRAEDRIANFVVENQPELEAIALERLAGNASAAKYKTADVDGVFNGTVQFTLSRYGIAPASRYRGFYYSQNGVPTAFQGADIPLELLSPSEWEWRDGTDNRGVTKHITGNWFYFEAWL